jgi:hypothetical protein
MQPETDFGLQGGLSGHPDWVSISPDSPKMGAKLLGHIIDFNIPTHSSVARHKHMIFKEILEILHRCYLTGALLSRKTAGYIKVMPH